ncbi:long-chain fatty acid--CoA ligase [Streptomyces sp. R302]|uniref:long-chain-fatty-acid--CoA ligase n=1 Tax=unclassified Streptomyces TaxID=2593676 RepID=UPI00145E7700|nr:MULTISPECIES: long-chain fatty acid--CoA ligase [unclassified Streptomyces]NML52517.1 long-chain fatty acid--CoA ligase [Streptomyces sp. R301]NML80554.1 long-chain fatty acid--CoA ligase [Streptomyces sp. R302]
MNLADLVGRSAAEHGDRTAVELGTTRISYAELDATVGRVAAMLGARGVRRGDRVGVMLPNMTEFPALYYGVLRAGAVVVPMNPLLKAREIAHYLQDSGAKLLFVFDAVAAEAAKGRATELVPVAPGALTGLLADHPDPLAGSVGGGRDTAVILYTSGTTGKPKGAELSHDNIARNTELCARDLFDLQPQDVVLGCLPLFHTFGQTCGMNTALSVGARLTLLTRFEPRAALDTLAADGVTVFLGVPTMFSALLAARHRAPGTHDVSALRLCASGGASLPVEVLHGFEKAFDSPVLEGYGMSETSPVITFNHPDRPRKAGTVGTPLQGVEVRLDAVKDGIGEVCVRGHNVMKGYWNRPDATAETLVDGWLHTGDLGRVDEDGYLSIVDRKKDLIIRGGYNVYPREIEEVLYEHPGVAEAAVIGLPHGELGEEVGAAVALHEGATATPDDLREFVRAQVAPYKYPRVVWLLDELPKGATGKILKREIAPPHPTA